MEKKPESQSNFKVGANQDYRQLPTLSDPSQQLLINQMRNSMQGYQGCVNQNMLLHTYGKTLSASILRGYNEKQQQNYLKTHLAIINADYKRKLKLDNPSDNQQKEWQNQVHLIVSNLKPITQIMQQDIVKITVEMENLREEKMLTPEKQKEAIEMYRHYMISNLQRNQKQTKVYQELHPRSRFLDPIDGGLAQSQPQDPYEETKRAQDVFNFDDYPTHHQPQTRVEARMSNIPQQQVPQQQIGSNQNGGMQNVQQNLNQNNLINEIQENYYFKDCNIFFYIMDCKCSNKGAQNNESSEIKSPL